MKYIAYTTKGLEKIALEEIQELCSNAVLNELGDKRVVFESSESQTKITYLKTVDDIGLLLANFQAETTEDILDLVSSLDLTNLNKTGSFSLTVGLAGAPKIKSAVLITAISGILHQKYSWEFTEFDHSLFDLRIFVDKKSVYISQRLTPESLHHRSWKTESHPGSLRPTVAAAMVKVATNKQKELTIVDNFCGSGTILCEAFLSNNQVYGGDLDDQAVLNTQQNLKNLKYKQIDRIKKLDALNTTWPDHFFDCAISNLPWDKQVPVESITTLYERTLREYKRILKTDGKICLLVSKPELLIKHAKNFFPSSNIETYPIGILGQNPTIVVIN